MRLAVTFPRDDKVQLLTRSERYLFIELILWSVEHGTDGRIPPSALRSVGDGHKGKARSLAHMATVGLLSVLHRAPVGPTYAITSFPKWQMVTERFDHKAAGQAPADGRASRAQVRARTENRTERSSIYQGSSSLAPEPVRMIDGVAYRHVQGSGWVKDHGSDQAARQGDQAEP